MIKKRIAYLVLIIAIISGLQSCKKIDETENEPKDNDSPAIEKLLISEDFNWESSHEIPVKVRAKDNAGNPMQNIKFSIYTDDPEEGGKFVFSGATGNNGLFERTYEFPAYFDSLTITTTYIGLPNMVRVPITQSGVDFTFGDFRKAISTKSISSPANINSDFVYLGGYDGFGVPDYLEEEDEVITQDLLDDINNTLPENVRLDESHPQYFENQLTHNLVLLETADVYVTYVHEGAGYKNVLGFYTFNKNNPPQSPNDIEEVTIIFPNVSHQYSGGGLVSGNTVHIGQFPADTEIGWVLISNGWNGSEVTSGYNTFYSNKSFNPEGDPDLRQHSVFLNDIGRELILLGFEDLHRQGWCDHDFNDAVFYIGV
ncbi:MAG: DUF4114 domain-containing protein, partial [Bacteroidales bacterium]|nr:DUF4114 domain-containing protein [Bacteroidales bacterium]